MGTVEKVMCEVDRTVYKHGLLSPERLAEALFDGVLRVPLPHGHIRGMVCGDVLLVNSNQPYWRIIGTLLHECGHREMHPAINQLFFHFHTYLFNSRFELEADMYALIYAARWYEYGPCGCGNLYELAHALGIPAHVADTVARSFGAGYR